MKIIYIVSMYDYRESDGSGSVHARAFNTKAEALKWIETDIEILCDDYETANKPLAEYYKGGSEWLCEPIPNTYTMYKLEDFLV